MTADPDRRTLEPVHEASPFPEELRRAEWRRERPARVGVGLSGGGIRSATVSLGFFQGLARHGLLRHLDYLSTVSGGGYFGSFYGHLLHRRREAPDGSLRAPEEIVAAVQEELAEPGAQPVRFLRENGRYLSPNGAGDLMVSAAVALRNWAAVMVVLGTLALLVLVVVVGLRDALLQLPGADGLVARWTGPPWVSPFFALAAAGLLVLAIPPGWAYWIVPTGAPGQSIRQWLGRWAVPAAGVAWTALWVWTLARGGNPPGGTWGWGLAALSFLATLTVGRYLLADLQGRRERRRALRDAGTPGAARVEGLTTLMRGALSRGLSRALFTVAGLFLLAVVDSIGGYLARLDAGAAVTGAYALLVGLVGVLRPRLMALLARPESDRRPSLPASFLANAAAIVLVLAFLGGLATVPHLVRDGTQLALLGAVLLAVALLVGGVWPFVNRSSLHAVYEARLRRAYLGATNPVRASEGEDFPPITQPHPGDGLPLAQYDPSDCGGPVHLINVTVNETVDGRSQVQQRDRKGVAMAVGPGGISVSRTHHARWVRSGESPEMLDRLKAIFRRDEKGRGEEGPGVEGAGPAGRRKAPAPFRVFPGPCTPESLDVGQWVAISGAAFSTGLGNRTSLGFSFLAGLFNIRLGYWWGSAVDPGARNGRSRRTGLQRVGTRLRGLLPVQWALLDEWFARFPGVARPEWYLSDGGHFENLGGYELIRRRLPFILLCDNEQDPDYRFAGLAGLVRKARSDFLTEIRFLEERELAAIMEADLTGSRKAPGIRWVGPLSALRRGPRSRDAVPDPLTGRTRVIEAPDRSGLSLAHAALARITYPPLDGEPESTGWLLYVKPTLVGDEPPDLTQYHRERPDFPHESTADQFFDEAQWEGYRKLGDWMATKLFQEEQGVVNPVRGLLDGSWRPRTPAGEGQG